MDASGHFSQSMAIVYRDIMINNGIFFVYPIFRQTQNSKCKLVWLNLEIIHLLKLYLNDVQQNWRSFCYQVCLLSLFRLPKVWSKLCFFVVNTNVVVAIPRHIQDLWHRVNTWTKGRSTLSTFHYGYIYIFNPTFSPSALKFNLFSGRQARVDQLKTDIKSGRDANVFHEGKNGNLMASFDGMNMLVYWVYWWFNACLVFV